MNTDTVSRYVKLPILGARRVPEKFWFAASLYIHHIIKDCKSTHACIIYFVFMCLHAWDKIIRRASDQVPATRISRCHVPVH